MATSQFKGGGETPWYGQTPSWLNAPPPGAGATMALVTHTNPVTGETWTAPNGGYTLNNNMLTGGGMPQNNMGGLAALIQADPNRQSYTDGPMAGGMAGLTPDTFVRQPDGSYVTSRSLQTNPQMIGGLPQNNMGGNGGMANSGMSNQNNFNFTPTPIASSGSYNTADYASLFGGLATGGLAGAAAGAGVNEAIGRLQALGQAGVTDYGNLAKASTQGINFTPYALTSSLGTTQQTAPGVISQQLTPQQQANVNAAQSQQGSLYGAAVPDTSGIAQGAFGQSQAQLAGVGAGQQDLASLRAGYGTAAQGMTGMLGGSTTDMANQLFQQQQGMRNPEQQRQQQALESRLLSQGRLGTTTAAYGGTPEQLAMAKAIQEQQSADAFNSMTQAEQMATSQQARALGLGNATSSMAQAQQALRQGDINAASGLFNIGSAAAQLPQQMQGQNIAQAGQLQAQALAPGAQQLQQAQLSANIGEQQANTAYKAGGLFGGLAGAGLQERLTAESAASATRVKQFDSILKSYSAQGGTASESANTIQQAINSGVKKIGDKLYDAGGKLLGNAAELLGSSTASLWDGIGNIFDTDAQFEADWQAALNGQLTSNDANLVSGVTGSISSGISDAWDWTKNLFGF